MCLYAICLNYINYNFILNYITNCITFYLGRVMVVSHYQSLHSISRGSIGAAQMCLPADPHKMVGAKLPLVYESTKKPTMSCVCIRLFNHKKLTLKYTKSKFMFPISCLYKTCNEPAICPLYTNTYSAILL